MHAGSAPPRSAEASAATPSSPIWLAWRLTSGSRLRIVHGIVLPQRLQSIDYARVWEVLRLPSAASLPKGGNSGLIGFTANRSVKRHVRLRICCFSPCKFACAATAVP